MSEPFVECSKCGNEMIKISPEDSSPLIVECQKCRHREYTEVQVSPPWPAETSALTDDSSKSSGTETEFRLFDFSVMPVSVGSPDDESPVVPVGWILPWIIVIGFIALVALLLWIIL